MSVDKIAVRSVVTAQPDEWTRDIAIRMKAREVGSVVVVDSLDRPIGIVTDRDITIRCVADGENPDQVSVADIMSSPVSSVDENTPIESALATMESAEVRRLPVVGQTGKLVGLLALDDVLDLLVEEVETIGSLLAKQGRW